MILQDGCKRLTNVLQTIEMYVTIVNWLLQYYWYKVIYNLTLWGSYTEYSCFVNQCLFYDSIR